VLIVKLQSPIEKKLIRPAHFINRVTKIFANPVVFFPYAVHRRNSITKYPCRKFAKVDLGCLNPSAKAEGFFITAETQSFAQ